MGPMPREGAQPDEAQDLLPDDREGDDSDAHYRLRVREYYLLLGRGRSGIALGRFGFLLSAQVGASSHW